LAEAGHSVTLIARGKHLEAIQRDGLTLIRPDAETTLKIPAVSGPEEAEIGPGDVVILAVKTQDSESVLSRLSSAAPHSARIVSAQNGMESERIALRRFADVYGMCVMLPADHLEPGVVLCFGSPVSGILDLGRFPHGTDEVAVRIAQDLSSSGFISDAVEDIMRLKAGKLMLNLHNVVDALGGEASLKTDRP
jgi:2-dehydropantoate 2-reductase